MNSKCIFCQIVRKEIPAKIIYEDDHLLAFYTIKPVYTIHALLIPKRHIENLSHINDIEALKCFLYMCKNFDTIANLIKLVDYRVIINSGKNAGQEVLHLHAHITSGTKLNIQNT